MISKKIIKKTKDINQFIIRGDKSLKDAIIKLNKYGKRILFVIDKKNRAIGSLSDGDIRKALLKNLTINNEIFKAVNKNFIYFKNRNVTKINFSSLKNNNIIFIPICDKKKRIKEIIDINNNGLVNVNKIPFIILAGGKGKRMGVLTQNKPKPLLKVNKKPILEHIISNAKKQGFERFIISIGYKGDQIKEYFKDGFKLGVKIEYISEKKSLGTAGFLSLLKLKAKKFVISNGDIISKVNYKNLIDFHDRNKCFATMVIRKRLNNETLGVVETSGKKFINIKEKPLITYNINSGIYILNFKVLKLVKKNKKTDMTDLFNFMSKINKRVYVFPIFENWIDIANSKDLLEVRKYFGKYNY